ncbi:MAG: hypothetical protein U0821_22585 [Chloroflexota bacterium]
MTADRLLMTGAAYTDTVSLGTLFQNARIHHLNTLPQVSNVLVLDPLLAASLSFQCDAVATMQSVDPEESLDINRSSSAYRYSDVRTFLANAHDNDPTDWNRVVVGTALQALNTEDCAALLLEIAGRSALSDELILDGIEFRIANRYGVWPRDIVLGLDYHQAVHCLSLIGYQAIQAFGIIPRRFLGGEPPVAAGWVAQMDSSSMLGRLTIGDVLLGIAGDSFGWWIRASKTGARPRPRELREYFGRILREQERHRLRVVRSLTGVLTEVGGAAFVRTNGRERAGVLLSEIYRPLDAGSYRAEWCIGMDVERRPAALELDAPICSVEVTLAGAGDARTQVTLSVLDILRPQRPRIEFSTSGRTHALMRVTSQGAVPLLVSPEVSVERVDELGHAAVPRF